MIKRNIYTICVLIFAALAIVSCKKENTLQIKGQFASSQNDTLYLIHNALGGAKLLDSVQLDANGNFKFKQPAPQNPEFYQLKLGSQVVAFAADSAETLQIKGDAKNLKQTFVVENSPTNDQLKQVDNYTLDVKKQIVNLDKMYEAKSITDVQYIHQLDSLLLDCKGKLSKIILSNPSGGAAYYAVFQKINDYLIFDPLLREDYGMYGAVATSWKQHYEGTPRYDHLYKFTLHALKTRKQQEQYDALLDGALVVTENVLPDVALNNIQGQEVKLSDYRGKVVLLDFTVYNSDFSPAHNIALHTVYKKLKAQGLEIYQISLDSDEHFWKNAANNLPWITVRDPQSVYSDLLTIYNVRNLPAAFVLDKNGNVVARVENYSTLENEIRKGGL